jgi:hypothetical protein
MTTSADAVHLLGGVAMTHFLLLVVAPGALSAALLTCGFPEVLLGISTRQFPVSRCDQLHINGVPPALRGRSRA